jgi:hypothetical protein
VDRGGGGVYLSVNDPGDYGFWDGDYETNMISDCYGSDQVDAIKAMQKFDMVVIYACNNVGEGTE